MPKRIQRKRSKDWRMPEGAVYVGRAKGAYGKWGNPINWKTLPSWTTPLDGDDEPWHVSDASRRHTAVVYFENEVKYDNQQSRRYPTIEEIRAELAGKDLVCWCPEGQSCHGDVLLKIANEEAGNG